MKKHGIVLSVLVILYLCVLFPFTAHLQSRPFIEKIGYTPEPEIMRLASADQKQFMSATLILRSLMYFGGLLNKIANRVAVTPDLPGMQRMIEGAVRLDPYNMDCYYFAQSTMVWDMKQVQTANALLEFGMRYRDWDWYLPFFAGFNYSYILKDYASAARNYRKVGELTGNELSINLTGRYLYEAGQTDQALAYLTAMIKSAKNDALRRSFQTRLTALEGVKAIELARDAYRKRLRKMPPSIDSLLKAGYLHAIPVDPYGGTFYIDDQGKVRSTSKFAYPVKQGS